MEKAHSVTVRSRSGSDHARRYCDVSTWHARYGDEDALSVAVPAVGREKDSWTEAHSLCPHQQASDRPDRADADRPS
eukprot:366301-Chlamydomonas_euryale.AAC.5